MVKLSKLVKEAKQLGYEIFSGSDDVVVAKNWLKRVLDILTYMDLDDDLKLKVASRLIDKSAATWWDNLKLWSNISITWDLFVQEFNEIELKELVEFERSVIEYDNELRELAEFVPELANFEEYLCFKFEEGLSLEIKEKMSITKS